MFGISKYLQYKTQSQINWKHILTFRETTSHIVKSNPANNITWSPRGYNVTFRGGNVVVLRNYHVTLSTLSYVVTTWEFTW